MHVQITALKVTFYVLTLTRTKHCECTAQCRMKEMVGEFTISVLYLTAVVVVQSMIQPWIGNG